MTRGTVTPVAVVAAAADLADREGFDAISVSAVARQLGVQPASLYSHVRDRAAILDGVQTLALAELSDAVVEGIAGRSGRDALVGLADAQRHFARTRPGRWAALQRPATAETAGSEPARRLVSLTWAVFRGYPLDEAELVHATRFVGATVNGFLGLERSGGFEHRPQDAEQSWARCLDALHRALTSWPTNGGAPS